MAHLSKCSTYLAISLFIAILAAAAFTGGCGKATSTQNPGPSQQGTQHAEQQPVSAPDDPDVILATTTSTYDTGLLDVLIPAFKEKTGYNVKPIPVGTGEALKMGKRGDADVLLVHAPKAEKPLVEVGIVIDYRLVMHNDFILVGPPGDPAGIKQAKTAAEAMKKIAAQKAIFVSRGDDSGTHKKETDLWQKAGIEPHGKWYVEAGSGMGQTLTIASEQRGYTLTDRGTYLALKRNLQLEVVLEGDPLLLNIYHVMQVNPEKFPRLDINADGAKAFVAFLTSDEGQRLIGEFGVDKYGEPLFVPDAGKDKSEVGAKGL